jgi:hypothetical protein
MIGKKCEMHTELCLLNAKKLYSIDRGRAIKWILKK